MPSYPFVMEESRHASGERRRIMSEPSTHEAMPYGARVPLDPVGFTLRYHDVESNIFRVEEHDSLAPFSDDLIAFDITYDGEVIEASVTPTHPVIMELVDVRLRHAFSTDEQVLTNGYQSWTDTRERPAWERLKGLHGVPEGLIKRYALDGGGDHRLVKYTGRRGLQHAFTYMTFRRDEGMVLLGSLDDTNGFTLMQMHADKGIVSLQTECPLGVLEPGKRVVLGRYAITRGTLDECYDRWFELSGITARPVRPLVGYTSWYRHYGDISEEKLENDLAGMIEHTKHADAEKQQAAQGEANREGASARLGSHGRFPAGTSGPCTRLFQIDDGYCKVGDWFDIDGQKFPHGLKSLADQIRDAGFLPGLWAAPFVCEKDSRLYTERQEWLLRDENGDFVQTGPQWSGGYALDTRNTEVRSYVLDVLRTMTRDWGFGLLKLDFLYAACMQPHDGLNRGQLMSDAVDLLRMGAGEDTLILGCGVPLASVFGRFDYCRIGCDVGLDWDDKPFMRALHRERVSTRHALGNTYARSPLDSRAFGNDPDVFFLRDDIKLSQAHRDEILFANAELGSVLLTSDDMGKWTDTMRQHYDEALRLFESRF